MKTAKLFLNGGSQAVRLPAEYRFEDVEEVLVERVGDRLMLTPRRKGWDEFFDRPSAVPADFLNERIDPLPQERDPF